MSICVGMGLLDKAFRDQGFEVIPTCEVEPRMRDMYRSMNGEEVIFSSLRYMLGVLPAEWIGLPIIGGPPCQSHSKLRAMRKPKFEDLTPSVLELLDTVCPPWFLFENVVPLRIPAWRPKTAMMDAMHYAKPHQSRPRWFTFSSNLTPPLPLYHGDVDDLMAYPCAGGKTYGPKRGAILQGYPAINDLPFPCEWKQLGIANAVHYGLGTAWAKAIKATVDA